MIPFDIFKILICLSVLATFYTWTRIDKNNYTDIITGLFSTITWIISGYSFFVGIYIDELVSYYNTSLGLLLVFFGLVLGLFTFMKILNFANPTDKELGDFS